MLQSHRERPWPEPAASGSPFPPEFYQYTSIFSKYEETFSLNWLFRVMVKQIQGEFSSLLR